MERRSVLSGNQSADVSEWYAQQRHLWQRCPSSLNAESEGGAKRRACRVCTRSHPGTARRAGRPYRARHTQDHDPRVSPTEGTDSAPSGSKKWVGTCGARKFLALKGATCNSAALNFSPLGDSVSRQIPYV